jgi:hypothetical protein
LDPATALSNGIVYLVEVGLPDPLPYIIEDYFPCNNIPFNILVESGKLKGEKVNLEFFLIMSIIASY